MTPAGRFCIAADHPCLPGHFPDQPVVPGVVLLDEALALIGAARQIHRIGPVKFLRPVLPGETVEVAFSATPAGDISFALMVGGAAVVTGRARLQPP